jgi:hypothetical protein
MSVSPRMMVTLATGTSTRSATTCAKLVSWPCPLGWVPNTTSTVPSGFHLQLRALTRIADRGLDVVGEAAAEQFAARLGFPGPLLEAVPVGDFERALHVPVVFAAVVNLADRIGVSIALIGTRFLRRIFSGSSFISRAAISHSRSMA